MSRNLPGDRWASSFRAHGAARARGSESRDGGPAGWQGGRRGWRATHSHEGPWMPSSAGGENQGRARHRKPPNPMLGRSRWWQLREHQRRQTRGQRLRQSHVDGEA